MEPTISNAERDVLNERRRQVKEECFTARGDDQYDQGTLASAATCYGMYAADMLHPMSQGDGFKALEGQAPVNWPWRKEWWKPKNPRDALVKAAAMLIAEIESLDRKTAEQPKPVEIVTTVSGVDMIPEMTDPLGKHWQQPDRQMIFFVGHGKDRRAHMGQKEFNKLKSYDRSYPSGTYTGKMWKRTNDGVSYLVWYGKEEGTRIEIGYAEIVINGG